MEMHDVFKRREQGGVAFELSVPQIKLSSGQFIAIVGDSGCGKSTLLDMLALVSRPTHMQQFDYFFKAAQDETGQIDVGNLWKINNEKGLAAIRKKYLGYVLQTGGLLPFLTVFQNIRLPALINGDDDTSYPKQLAKKIGVDRFLNKKPQFLSGGQRQRVAIIRALAHKPRLILADEPTAAVDKKRAGKIVEDFYALAEKSGTTIVMVTHDRELVRDISNATYTFEVNEVSESLTQSVTVKI